MDNIANIKRNILLVLLSITLFFLLYWGYANLIVSDEIYGRQVLSNSYPRINKTLSNYEQIKKGEYLVKLGNCITCHTDKASGGAPFAGGLMIKTPFGNVPSTNITPDKKAGIGQWSKAQFVKAMTEGVSPEGKNYYPAFPYLYFSNISKPDLEAIYDYLQAIPANQKSNLSPSFPLNIWGFRTLVKLWNIFASESKPKLLPRTEKPMLQIGAYIVNGLGHCGMCHTNRNSLGIAKKEFYLSGAFVGNFWAPNISELGLKHTSYDDLIKVFKQGELMNNAGPLAGPMADVSQNSLQFLSERDANAIAQYLKQLESKPVMSVHPAAKAGTKVNLKRGKTVYYQVCMICHEAGIASAPKLGSESNWYNRVQTSGIDALYNRTYYGFNNMPKLGGCVNCTQGDVISAVDYMLKTSLSNIQWSRVRFLKQQSQRRKQRQKQQQLQNQLK